MWGCDRKSRVKDVSNIFGLSNSKNEVAIILHGEDDRRSRLEAEDTRSLV